MKIVLLHKTGYPSWADMDPSTLHEDWTGYPLPPDGWQLYFSWKCSSSLSDPPLTLLSGILADWLEDHLDLLLLHASGPDPATRLQTFIQSLRDRFEGK